MRCVPVLLLGLAAASQPAFAVDGVIEINQAKMATGGVTPGDGPGFPVTLDQAGSYRLTGNLTVPNENTDAIVVTADNVTLDLNGFSILGPTSCHPLACSPTGSGEGIIGSAVDGITVKNGTVQGMGSDGIIFLVGATGVRIEGVRAISNGRTGISANANATVINSTALRNGLNGISTGTGSLVAHNTAHDNQGSGVANAGISLGLGSVGINNSVHNNDGDGIGCSARCTVLGNNAGNNGGFGLRLGTNSGYAENVVNNNTSGTVSGGIEIGLNVCENNTTCP